MCFTLGWLASFLVQCVIIFATIAIIRLVVPWLTGLIGLPILAQVVNIILWAIVAIFAIYVVFGLLSCLWSVGGGIMPHFPIR